jgi:peptidoglycan/LPS O-acetylase OafA/YrhL
MNPSKQPAGPVPGKRPFLNCLNQYRGLAILLVVIGHCFYLSDTGRRLTFLERFWECFYKNSTVYFVFIAGFLFHHLQAGRFRAGAYFRKRLPRLVVPFLLFSILALAFHVEVPIPKELFPDWLGGGGMARKLFVLVTGATYGPYWYIPMAVLLALLSPAVLWAVRQERLIRWLLPLLFAGAVFTHRPLEPNFNTFHSLFYYLPVYLFGAVCARDQATVLPASARTVWIWWALGLAATALQAEFYTPGNFHKPMFQYAGPDVNLVAKMFLTLGILGLLVRRESRPVRILDFFAVYSFSIYFLHPIAIWMFGMRVDLIPFRTHLFMLPVVGLVISLLTGGLAALYFGLVRKIRAAAGSPASKGRAT